MKKRIKELKGSKDWLREGGNRVRLTGGVYYFYHGHKEVICVEHEMGTKFYEVEEGLDAGELEVEVELA